MSHGLQVWSDAGSTRIFNGSWVFKYHSTHTVSVPANSNRFISVPGFNPNIWGVQVAANVNPNATPVNTAGFVLENGGVRIYTGHRGAATVRVTIFKG